MGYRLAGCRVLGAVEVDPNMAKLYELNLGTSVHVDKIQHFKKSQDALQYEDVDILDGSPPCTLFSVSRIAAGNREGVERAEDLWSKDASFKEGGIEQRLADLFFDYLDLAETLKPKILIAENVTGMVVGKARGYAKLVMRRMREIGYRPQCFKLNASRMGVPQRRERIFFFGLRNDIDREPLYLNFEEPEISVKAAFKGLKKKGRPLTDTMLPKWESTKPGASFDRANGTTGRAYFNWVVLDPNKPSHTVTATINTLMRWDEPRLLCDEEFARLQSFPDDYDYHDQKPLYVLGMSVPPLMIERIATEIRRQWL